MVVAKTLLPLYTFMAWTGTAFIVTQVQRYHVQQNDLTETTTTPLHPDDSTLTLI